jgi:GWxTD domain-containing protein
VLALRADAPSPPRSLDKRTLRIDASDALHKAFALDQNNPDHYFALGTFYATAGVDVLAGHKSRDMFERAYERFFATGDSALKADLLLRMGDEDWFFYNKFEERAIPMSGAPGTVTRAAGRDTLSSLPRLLAHAASRVIEGFGTESDFELAGEAHYLAARKYYENARRVAPGNERAFRSLARLYATRDSWEFLLALATDYTRRVPRDPWGWMALGLAQHRRGSAGVAAASLDSGLARMKPAIRSHLDRLDRVLGAADSARYVAGDSALRAQMAQYFWTVAEPLWTTHGEQPRVEFLARLAYAELRYSELHSPRPGPDTPRGQVYVRYGPPAMKRQSFWLYPSGIIVLLPPPAGNLEAKTVPEPELFARVTNWQPARWDNIAATTIDSMPVQIARFRAAPDSVDFFLATRAPSDSLRANSPANTEILSKFWLLGLTARDAHRDSLPLPGAGSLQWTRRVAAGQYYFRVEATAIGMARAARASALITIGDDPTSGFSLRGFGMSDIIIAADARSAAPARRWRDLVIDPVLTTISRSDKVAIVWETYEPGQRSGMSDYSVAITLELDDASSGAAVAARLVRGTTGAGSTTRKARNSLTYTFDRSVPYAAAIVESVDIQLENTPPGDYFVRIAITDKVSGRTTTRSTGIVIR